MIVGLKINIVCEVHEARQKAGFLFVLAVVMFGGKGNYH